MPGELLKASQHLVCQKNTWLTVTFQVCAANHLMPSLTEAFFGVLYVSLALASELFYPGRKYETSGISALYAFTTQPTVALSMCQLQLSAVVSSRAEGSRAPTKTYRRKKS